MALASNNKVASSLSPMASGDGAQSHSQSHHGASGSSNTKSPGSSTEYQLRKYLLLLATLVATVTYVAGLNLPGGAWQEDTKAGQQWHRAGDPILQVAHLRRYLTFYYCNATAFAASLVVSLLLLVLDGKNTGWWEPVLRVVMVLDLLGLMGAYAAGSCRDKFTTVYSALLVCAVFAYVVVAFVVYLISRIQIRRPASDPAGYEATTCSGTQLLPEKKGRSAAIGAPDAEKQGGSGSGSGSGESATDGTDERRQELHEVLMLLATFAVTITYVAALNPPGGFWSDTKDTHKMSDPVLMEHYSSRYQAFYVCNTTAFVASLLIIILLLDKKLTTKLSVRSVALYGLTVTALLGLMGAYAAGSCRQLDDTTYVICLIAGVLAYIFLLVVVASWSWIQNVYKSALKCLGVLKRICGFDDRLPPVQINQITSRSSQGRIPQEQNHNQTSNRDIEVTGAIEPQDHQGSKEILEAVQKEKPLDEKEKDRLEKAQSLVMLLATLVVSITYSAGLDPPGGLWPDTRDGHIIGDPILLTTHPARYKVFFYSNSAAFVASLVVILMVQCRFLLEGGKLEAVMILDLFGLISAYAAGSCRDETTSIYVVALAGCVLVYVVIHIVLFTLDHKPDNPSNQDEEKKLEDRREVLLLLAILAATLTYQAGLTPPGGFWSEDNGGHRAGYPVLHDNYRPRYSAFFYCNAASFMASVALIVLLVNPNLYRPGIRCYALFVCMVVGMFGLMGAYAAGSSRDLRTSIYVLTLVAGVFAFIALEVVIFWVRPWLKDHWNQWFPDLKEHWNKWLSRCLPGCGSSEEKKDSGSSEVENDSGSSEENKERNMREYLMLLGMLAASVTYQTGLKPPGGLWQDNSVDHSAGSSILHYINKRRYHAFFYCNSTSFMASVVVIILLLHSIHRLSQSKQQADKPKLPLWPMHTAILLDMLGLLGAYAAGSARDWETSRKVICMVFIPVLVYAAIAAVSMLKKTTWCQCATGQKSNSDQEHKSSSSTDEHQK